MKQATPARSRASAAGSAVLARCTGIAAVTGQRCKQRLLREGRCPRHAGWVPPMFYTDAQVTRTLGNGKCACCVQGIGPHVCFVAAA